MPLLSLCSLFIRRCTCRLRGGLFIFYRPVHTMPKHDIDNHELLIANHNRHDKYLKDLGSATHV